MHKENSIPEEDFHLIEAYLKGQLDDLKASEVRRRLAEDLHFKATFEEIETIQENLETAFLIEKMDNFHKDLEDQKPIQHIASKKRKTSSYLLPVAAVLVISLGIFWFLQPNQNERLFQNYFSPDPGLPTVMSETSNFQFYDGMVNYKKGEYEIALEKWNALLKENTQNDTLNYFIGMAYMAAHQDVNAISYIDQVMDNQDSKFREDAQYYKALFLIKNEDINTAIRLLKGLTNNAKAQSLLKEIESYD